MQKKTKQNGNKKNENYKFQERNGKNATRHVLALQFFLIIEY